MPDPKLKDLLNIAYQNYQLNFFGKKVWTPYRINLPYQSDRRKYGKWAPSRIRADVASLAKEKNFNLRLASADQIRQFMVDQKLGIDCSGYVYNVLDYALREFRLGSMSSIVHRLSSWTNVLILTDEKVCIKINPLVIMLQSGDLIRIKNGSDEWHILIIMEVTESKIVYTNSQEDLGVTRGEIMITDLTKTLSAQNWPLSRLISDEVFRLKVFDL